MPAVQQAQPSEHACCETSKSEQPKPTGHRSACDCSVTHLTTQTGTQPALVTVHADTHLVTLPALPVAVLSDLAVSPRPLTASFDTPPPRSAQTLRAQHCLLLI